MNVSKCRFSSHAFGKADAQKKSTTHNRLDDFFIEGEVKLKIVEVKGNTYCIDTRMTYIPFYKINDNEIIMLDSG